MRDPLRRLKTLPWAILLQNAALTVLIAAVLDFIFLLLLNQLPTALLEGGFSVLLNLLFLVLPVLAMAGVGALSVILMERFFQVVYLDTAVLWALVPCIGLMLFLKGLIPNLPEVLVGLSYSQIVGVVLGVFLKGKRYWRS
ncbi:MAG TPA: hypothetical protein V6D06_18745 [Trichocoleus sp.]